MVEAALAPVGRRTFLVEAAPHHDVLLRVLGPFAVQGARIVSLEAAEGPATTSIRIEAQGIGGDLADHLVEQLRRMPSVASVGLVWRLEAAA